MSWLDNDKIAPNGSRSISGILPEVISQWNEEVEIPDDLNCFPELRTLLKRKFPQGYNSVVMLIVDGLGVNNLTPGLILDNLETSGIIATSTFPSITSTAMTSLLYGTDPATHGIVGYNILNMSLQKVVNMLRMRYRSGEEVLQVFDAIDLSDLVTGSSLTKEIQSQIGERFSFLVPSYLRPPGLGDLLNPGIKPVMYENYEEIISTALKKLDTAGQFIGIYVAEVDSAGHEYGPNSEEYRAGADRVQELLSKLLEHPSLRHGTSMLLLTADHGQVEITREHSISRQEWLNYVDQGVVLGSSGRVVHGYSTDNDPLEVKRVLSKIAEKGDMIIAGEEVYDLIGGRPEKNYVGDYLLLSGPNSMVNLPDSLQLKESTKLGHHGGLTEDEMLIPVIVFGGSS